MCHLATAASVLCPSLLRQDNIFEWHFTLRGPQGTEFESGSYHGRILLPAEYPFRPPSLMLLTPNGRWECNKKVSNHPSSTTEQLMSQTLTVLPVMMIQLALQICLTFTGFHEEMWQPAWGVRTALLGVQAFMSARAEAATGVGSLDYPIEERLKLADRSKSWICPTCDKANAELLPDQGERTAEALPDGLQVDITRQSQPQDSDATTSTPEAQTSNLQSSERQQQQEAVTAVSQVSDTSALAASVGAGTALTAAAAAETEPSAQESDRVQQPSSSDDTGFAGDRAFAGSSTSANLHQGASATVTSSHHRFLSSEPIRDHPEAAAGAQQQTSKLHETRSSTLEPQQQSTLSQSLPRPPAQQPFRPEHLARQSQRETLQQGRAYDRAEALSSSTADFARPLTSIPAANYDLRPQPHQEVDRQADPLPPPPPIARRPTRSEARVAQLDRAILTVVLLLCGLVVRRLL